jgi:predicted nucleotidyltransferase
MESVAAHPALARLIARAKRDPEVLALLLFGSRARGDSLPESDLDVCLVLGAESRSPISPSQKLLEYLEETDLDLSLFQLLPLYIRSRILKEGTILFARDEDALYALAIRTARAFEGFRHIYREYLEQVARD